MEKNIKVYTAEDSKLFMEMITKEKLEYDLISIFDIGEFDKLKWRKHIDEKCTENTDKLLVIMYVETSLHIVDQEHILEDIIGMAQRPVYIYTDSPYVVSGEYMDYLNLL